MTGAVVATGNGKATMSQDVQALQGAYAKEEGNEEEDEDPARGQEYNI